MDIPDGSIHETSNCRRAAVNNAGPPPKRRTCGESLRWYHCQPVVDGRTRKKKRTIDAFGKVYKRRREHDAQRNIRKQSIKVREMYVFRGNFTLADPA